MTTPSTAGPITHRRVLNIALPIVLSNATIPLLGAVDTGVVGQMGEAAPIGAVGIGAVVLSALYWVFGFLRMGTTGMAAQAVGQGDVREVSALLTRVLMIGGASGLVILAGQGLLIQGTFLLSPASAEVEGLAYDYMSIRVWSAPAAIATLGILGWLIAAERTRAVLAIQLCMTLTNMVLDILFVLGFGWGVSGVAVATVIAEWSALGLGLWFCRAAFSLPAWRDWPLVFDRARLLAMARVNTDILIRSALLEGVLLSFMFVGARFSDVTLAANQVLLQFLHIVAYALDGFAFSAEALVGQAMGARARAQLREAALMTSSWALGLNVLLAILFWLAGPAIIDLMAKDPDVQQAARAYLPWMVAAPVLGIAAWMLDGIFIGATRTADMRNMMAISVLIYAISAVILVPPFGNHGLWAAMMICFLARGLSLGLRYPALERAAS